MFLVTREKSDSGVRKGDTYKQQGSYAGDWYRDKKDGFGTMIFANGDKCVPSTFASGAVPLKTWSPHLDPVVDLPCPSARLQV